MLVHLCKFLQMVVFALQLRANILAYKVLHIKVFSSSLSLDMGYGLDSGLQYPIGPSSRLCDRALKTFALSL
jgi:hypothetical protein